MKNEKIFITFYRKQEQTSRQSQPTALLSGRNNFISMQLSWQEITAIICFDKRLNIALFSTTTK